MFTNSMCAWVHQWYNKINVGAMPQQFNFSPAIYTVFSLSGVPALLVIPLTAQQAETWWLRWLMTWIIVQSNLLKTKLLDRKSTVNAALVSKCVEMLIPIAGYFRGLTQKHKNLMPRKLVYIRYWNVYTVGVWSFEPLSSNIKSSKWAICKNLVPRK